MSANVPASRKLYALLKNDIARGRFAPGAQLPLADLARELGTSVQPVRDVLARLVGERMLTFHPRAGFQVPLLTRREIRDLVDWHAHLLRMVLRERRPDWALPDMSNHFSNLDETDPLKVAELAAALFAAIAMASENIEHVDAIKVRDSILSGFATRRPRLLLTSSR